MRFAHRLAEIVFISWFSLGGLIGTATASPDKALSIDPVLGLETGALKGQYFKNPFVAKAGFYHLSFSKAGGPKIDFPKTLDAATPIILHTRLGTAKQFIVSKETYQAELKGRYLIYRGTKNSILYRFDTDKNSLREFVYLQDAQALYADGQVINWRFEGAELYALPDGSVALAKTVDIINEVRKVSNDAMAERIHGFMAKRQGTSLKSIPVIKTLFTIPKPEYIDGHRTTHTENIRYKVAGHKLTLHLDKMESLVYPLWADPTFRAGAHADIILEGQGGNSNFGISVASAGDFNGDGLDDVIVGDNSADANGQPNSGSAYIFFGRSPASQIGLVADADADIIINGQRANNRFGGSVASTGDFNGDGLDDVIIGADHDDNDVSGVSGSAFIFFGQNPTSQLVLRPDTDADVILDGQSAEDRFGKSVASAGDFNGDGLKDVIVGADGDDNNGKNSSGSAFIFFGQSPSAQISLRADADADVILEGQNEEGGFGWSVASAGDFNGDGLDDVIIGESYLTGSLQGTGISSAYIFFGQNLTSQLVLRAGTDADVIMIEGMNESSFGSGFGGSVASAGDFNGDGLDDVIVGSSGSGNNGVDLSGSAYIFFGQNLVTQLTLMADADADVIFDGQIRSDGLGGSVASVGDINSDGFDDVIVGAKGSDSSVGEAYIFFGQNPSSQISLRAGIDADLTIEAQVRGDHFGVSVASAGDFNGDGLGDVIVGADDRFFGIGEGVSGSAYIFFTPVDAPTVFNDFDADSTSDLLIYNTTSGITGVRLIDDGVLQSSTSFAFVVAADPAEGWILSGTGDFNGDRKADILFYNTTSGELRVVSVISPVEFDTIVASLPQAFGLQPQGIGDIDGDGDSDILLFNATTGMVVGLLMDGDTITTAQPIIDIDVGNDWTLLNTGDFDGDGTTDLFLYNTVSGAMSYVPLNGLTPSVQVDLFTLSPALGWNVVDTGDFDGDGKTDLLILNTNGTLAVTLLDGVTLVSAHLLSNVDAANGWTVVNAGDYDGDGDLDVLLFNTVTLEVSILLLDGTTLLGGQPVTPENTGGGWIVHPGKP